MLRWFTALLVLAAALAAPASVRTETRAFAAEAAEHDAAACCGGACTCGPACACVADGSDSEPHGNEAPAPARDRDERTLAVQMHRVTALDLIEAGRSPVAEAPTTAAVRPAGRALLERIARWTT